VFGPGVKIADGATIRAFSHIEGATISTGCEVGPFARLRPGAVLGEGAKVGNFVEVKKAELGKGAKANHLSYIGDASVGEKANIGAGTITCNYDGFGKYRTEIGPGAFIGSNSALVAPVSIGAGAIVGAGFGRDQERRCGRSSSSHAANNEGLPAGPPASGSASRRRRTRNNMCGIVGIVGREPVRSGCSTV
jgi:bifunctional N-acetylglucosamine-1-phosphate-uridyltransferase/glucosamine-1-phosphate-acetyltransferase GlmU-like protein